MSLDVSVKAKRVVDVYEDNKNLRIACLENPSGKVEVI